MELSWLPMAILFVIGIVGFLLLEKNESEIWKKKFTEIEDSRKKTIQSLLDRPIDFDWVWVTTGFDEGREYLYCYALPKSSGVRVQIASIQDFEDLKWRLISKGIVIHSGPPGTTA